ncbi:MAG: family 20 glycosylhydrolase [Arcicella sp.]|nr:family 20 glycosylhydrolase [Arcicella sp.]
MKKIIVLLLSTFSVFAQNNIIPTPVSYENVMGTGMSMFMLDARTSVEITDDNPEAKKIAENLVNSLGFMAGQKPVFKKVPTPTMQDKVMIFTLNKAADAKLGNEGYTLDVDGTTIKMVANKPAGLFYATQTLRQLMPAQAENKDFPMGMYPIMGCKITDYPRFGWRGLMLDVSRHFFTKDEVKSYIDLMARYKFNIFHWHLVDDNGWRIEIKALPKLTEIGSKRVARFGHYGNHEEPKEGEPATYGGFYTQEEIKEVIQYAAERHVSIVPEIDVPGHSMEILAAYPELSTQKDVKRYVNPGTTFSEWFPDGTFKMLIENTLNPSDEKVYEFLDKVFTEVAALFPSKYIHMGGDEAYHGFWEKDPNCQAFMKKNNLKNTHELQSYFVKRVEKIINKKGKTMMGWDEILEGGLAPNAAVMSWRGMKGGIEAARQKHDVVMSPTTFAYLDYMQGDATIEVPIYSSLSLKKAYEFEPVPDSTDAKYILGGQANLWTEQVQNYRHALYMTYPRAFAISESVWSPKEKKNWDSFIGRTEVHFNRFDVANLKISKAVYDAIVTTKKDGEKLICEMTCDVPGTEIFYTWDDSFPDKFSPKYSEPIEIPKGVDLTLKVVTIRNGQPTGRILMIPRAALEKRAKK